MGIGFPDKYDAGTNWIAEAYRRSLIPAPAYSLILGRYQSSTITDGSLLILGGYDESLVNGDINWVPCSASFHVQIPLDAIIVNNHTIKRVDGRPMQAIIDVPPPRKKSDFSPARGVLSLGLQML